LEFFAEYFSCFSKTIGGRGAFCLHHGKAQRKLKESQANEGEVHSFEIYLADFAYLFQLHTVNSASIV
jgi:hypothetical protein